MAEHTMAQQSGTFNLGGDLPVYRLGFGAMRITGKGIWGPPADRKTAIQVVQKALDLGINFIDTADSYGPYVSEEIIAEALHPYRDGVVIATKGGLTRSGPDKWDVNGKPEHLREALEGSLKRLKRETIDLYQLHRIDTNVPLEETVGVLKTMQDEGKIRHIGVSEVNAEQLRAVQKIVSVVSVQNRYNLTDREWDSMVDLCESENIGFIPWFPLATGKLAEGDGPLKEISERLDASPSQVALAWLLKRSSTMLPIPGTGSVKHLEENTKAATIELSDEDYQSLCNVEAE